MSCADEADALLIFDEVQTGCGLTEPPGHTSSWMSHPISWSGKKTQVCGVCRSAGGRGRRQCVRGPITAFNLRHGVAILPTWCAPAASGGHRSRGPVRAGGAARYLRARLDELAADFWQWLPIRAAAWLMCAFSLPTTADRDEIRQLWQRAVIVSCRPVQTPCDSVHR